MEKILSIQAKDFEVSKGKWTDYYEGYEITTSEQVIHIGVTSGQSCCESFGTIITNDDTSEFIGSDITRVELVDETLNNKKIEEIEYFDCGGAMFVNIVTSVGVLQFVAYNSHNGYYGHDAVLISKQLNNTMSV